ncbi:MAG: hypothetical protein II531_00290 [Bacteroidales bacterium]|nr:hypothetical protein [Bacteroidales bacterium]
MKKKKILSLLLVGALLAAGSVTFVGCKSSDGVQMYQRQKSNRGAKVKTNIKVKGNNKSNGNTTRTRSY